MISFSDISVAIKIVTASIVAIVGAFLWVSSNFETVSAAEQKWDQHNRAIACRTVYELEERIQGYLDQVRFDPSLTPKDKEWIELQIKHLNAKIKRIDPDGNCP